jgi:small subunit ribosomal protein S7
MSRRRRPEKRVILPDPQYGDQILSKFMNNLMYDGKKAVAEGIVYSALQTVEAKAKADPIQLFHDALNNVKPQVEVRSRRVGGATYQVPVEVRPERAQALAIRWLIGAARNRSENTMMERLSGELLDALVELLPATDALEEIEEYINRNFNEYWSDKTLMIEDKNLCDNLVKKVKPFFGDNYDLSALYEAHRQKPGEGMSDHFDGGYDSRLLRSMLFYINDDFSGGELYFPELNFEYKPKAGNFITFPSHIKYVHGIRAVGAGADRYVLSGFAWEAGSLYKSIADH